MRKYNADFILVCENRIFGSEVSIGARLSKGGLIPWLKPVDTGPGPLDHEGAAKCRPRADDEALR